MGLLILAALGGLVACLLSWHLLRTSDTFTSFECPIECDECCAKPAEGLLGEYSMIKMVNRWVGNKDLARFVCVMPVEDIIGFKVLGRCCTKAEKRNSDPSQGSSVCDFTAYEKGFKVGGSLPMCVHNPRIDSYDVWINDESYSKDPCSLTHTGRLTGVHLIESIINWQYFTVKEPITGGVCGSKLSEFLAAGLLKKPCDGLGEKECKSAEKERLCKMLRDDFDAGRLDEVALGMWAGAIGELQHATNFSQPAGTSHLLRKFRIPGWSSRTVAWEALPGDKQINVNGGAFQCMIKKLSSFPVTDDLDNNRNLYQDQQDSTDVHMKYFDRYSVYQKPLHFVVPPDQLQTDETVSALVFQSIGAHRLEPIVNGLAVNLSPIGIDGRMNAPTQIPSGIPKTVGFVVRIEGLFETIPVRQSMEAWGGNAFFSKKGELLAIQYRGETQIKGQEDPERWHALKFIFRSSLISTVTAFDHLVSTHILAANSLAIAAVETLPVTHGLRHVLTPHVWGSLSINLGAATNLFAKGMLVHRASPFADEAFQQEKGDDGKLWKMIPALRYTTFEELYEKYIAMKHEFESGFEEIPFFEDGKLLHETLKRYVANVVHFMYGPTDKSCNSGLQADKRVEVFIRRFFEQNAHEKHFYPGEFQQFASSKCNYLITFLTEVIFLVTGWHKHVGTVADFFRDTRFASTSWKKGETQATPKHSMLMQLLAATTNANYPRLNQSLTDIYSRDSQFRDIFERLGTSMNEVQQSIERRNQKREDKGRLGFHQMEPMHVEWGVQV